MAEKTVKELAQMVQKPVEKLLEQLAAAGMPQRTADSAVSESEQEQLVSHLQRSHGQAAPDTRIGFKRKITTTAKVTGTSGKAKAINVEVRKKQVFAKPDPALIAAEVKALSEQKNQSQAEVKARVDADAKVRSDADARQKATLDAMRAQHVTPRADTTARTEAVVVKRGASLDSKPITPKPVSKPVVKVQAKKESPSKSG
jgi:translation initiation factor IF-2